MQVGYGLNYLIDTAHAVIVDVEATPARTFNEVAATRTMLERTRQRRGLKPRRLACGTGKFLGVLKTQQIAPHIPVWDKAQRTDGIFLRSDFTYDAEHDIYTCRAGKMLRTKGKIRANNTRRYLASVRNGRTFTLNPRCCPNVIHGKITRDVNEDARDHARARPGTDAFRQSACQRKKVDRLFTHLKRQMGFERLRLRGRSGASEKFLLAATVQKLSRLARDVMLPPEPATAT